MSIAEQIRLRAAQLRMDVEYIGLFDLTIYAALRKRRVRACFGTEVVDLIGLFAPWANASLDETLRPANFVGCVATGGHKLVVATSEDGFFPKLNHWVIGLPVAGVVDLDAEAAAAPPKKYLDARLAAGKAGLHVKVTVTDGNCGIDCMSFWDGTPRHKKTWAAIREEVADYMREVADQDLWHDTFRACAESKTEETVASEKAASAKAASAKAAAAKEKPPEVGCAAGLGSTFLKWCKKVPKPSSFMKKAESPTSAAVAAAEEAESPPGATAGASSDKASAKSDASGASARVPEKSEHASFEEWLNANAGEPWVRAATGDYAAYKELEDIWKAKHPRAKAAKPMKPSRARHDRKLHYKGWVASQYAAWRAGPGKDSKQPYADFMPCIRVYPGRVPKRDKMWLSRIVAFKKSAGVTGIDYSKSWGTQRKGGRIVPGEQRMRTPGKQGAPHASPEIREALWDWFVDMRASMATTVSPKFVLAKARLLAAECLNHMRATHCFSHIPELNTQWLLGWKREYGVGWRKPNAKYKVSWPKLKERCCATWLNVIRVQQFAKRVLNKTLEFIGIDEKPVHFNEGGSKNVCTLEIKGVESVELKTNHAASRERATVMTFTTSDKKKAARPEWLPMEMMCKAGSRKRLSKVRLPDGMNLSLAWSPKGSYRQDDIMTYLRRWLEEWTPERAEAGDYQILLLDVARSHIGNEIVDFAWSRGYITMYHYGGVTGVIQVNDTDLHAPFQREFLHCEEFAFSERQKVDATDIGREFQDVVDDCISVWKVIDHTKVANGYKSTGFSVALDGSEDASEISRSAAEVWKECHMTALKREAIAQVNAALDARVAKGEELSMSLWRSLIQHPKDPGVLPEGFELEGELLPGERPWLETDSAEVAKDEAEEKVLEAELSASEAPVVAASAEEEVPSSWVIELEEDDDPAAVEEATLVAKELAQIERLRVIAVQLKNPVAARAAAAQATRIKKKFRSGTSKAQKRAQLVLSRHLRAKCDAEREETRKKRDLARELKVKEAKRKASEMEAKAVAVLAEDKKKALVKALASIPKSYSPKELGQDQDGGGKAKEQKARQDCLERVKLRSPPLPKDLEAAWPETRNNYARQVAIKHGKWVGERLITEVNRTIEELGKYFDHPDPKIAAKFSTKPGSKTAFVAFVRRMSDDKKVPSLKPATATPQM